YLLFAISGSQSEIVAKIASHYGFDDFVGSTYERKGNKFTGKKIIAKDSKHIILQNLVSKHGATYKNSIGVGDSEGDLTMLGEVSRPIAFNPSKLLFEEAKKRGWPIVIERKNMIYNLEPKDGKYLLV